MFHRFTGRKTGILPLATLFAAAGSGGFFVGLAADWGSAAPDVAEIIASDTLNLRFPPEWADAAPQGTATYAFASTDSNLVLFDPNPVYPAPAARQASTSAIASLDQSTPVASEQAAMLATDTTTMSAVAVASISPADGTPPKVSVKRSNAVLSDQQIASIKRRLKLNRQQERYWPAVAAELRKMEYKREQQGGKTSASVDMSKVNIERLKSAGFPLIKSFNDDQRQELKSLAHLLGLENALAGLLAG
jgi:hypothetical protein